MLCFPRITTSETAFDGHKHEFLLQTAVQQKFFLLDKILPNPPTLVLQKYFTEYFFAHAVKIAIGSK